MHVSSSHFILWQQIPLTYRVFPLGTESFIEDWRPLQNPVMFVFPPFSSISVFIHHLCVCSPLSSHMMPLYTRGVDANSFAMGVDLLRRNIVLLLRSIGPGVGDPRRPVSLKRILYNISQIYEYSASFCAQESQRTLRAARQ